MSQIPAELFYAKTHEWFRRNEDGTVTLGITDYAQEHLGDLVFVELPEVGTQLTVDGEFAVVESVKAASDVYSSVNGEVIAVNDVLADSPERINEDPYGDGWLVQIQPTDAAELEALMDADAYAALLEAEESDD